MIAEYRSLGRSFVVGDGDLLWLGRAIFGESGNNTTEHRSVLWTLARRFLYGRFGGSFVDFVRAFCQPVNPRWYPSGDLFDKFSKINHPAASAAAGARRLALAGVSWQALPAAVQRSVLSFQAGALVDNLKTQKIKSTNFASYEGIEQMYPAGLRVTPAGNWFFSDIVGGAVVVTASARPSSGLPLALAAAAFLIFWRYSCE